MILYDLLEQRFWSGERASQGRRRWVIALSRVWQPRWRTNRPSKRPAPNGTLPNNEYSGGGWEDPKLTVNHYLPFGVSLETDSWTTR